MNPAQIERILEKVRAGEMRTDEALALLKDLPFSDLGFARMDHHRELRTGIPEIIWGENKTAEQIAAIARRMTEKGSLILISRIDSGKAQTLQAEFPGGNYHHEARIFSLNDSGEKRAAGRGRIVILAAGTSDVPIAEESFVTATLLGNEVDRIYDVGVSGLHRLLAEVPRLREAAVLIVIAGMEGALPSVVAGLVGKPIVAVPTSIGYGTGLGGIAALLAMLNGCAPGVTVVNIDNGVGAAVAAHMINRP